MVGVGREEGREDDTYQQRTCIVPRNQFVVRIEAADRIRDC
jgi:hypothetical protein